MTGVFLAVIAVGLLLGWALGADDNVERAEVGGPAPDFTVALIPEGQFSLSEQLASGDRPVVLNLWASWCGPCREEIPAISAYAESHPEVLVIGVAVEDTEAASRQFAEEMSPSYDLALGDAAFESAYPRLGLPATYVIAPDGTVKEVFNGVVTIPILEELVTGL